MTNIKLTVNGAKATAAVDGILTSGSVGIPVTIEYDSSWDGLTKSLVCASGKWETSSIHRTMPNIDTSATVAHEVLIANNQLYLGVEGRNADGSLVIRTTLDECGKILPGADANADPSAIPTLPIWAQLEQQIDDLKKNGNTGIECSYTLPVATSETLGGVMPVAKTDDMTQEVGVDADGRLYTAPSTSTGGGSGEIADGSITPEKTTFFNQVQMGGGDREVWTANSMHQGTMLDKEGKEVATPTLTGMGVSDYLPVSYGSTVTINGMWQNGYNSGRMFYYDGTKTLLGYFTPASGSVTTFTVDNEDAAYFRFNARSNVSSVIVSSEATYEYVIKEKHIPTTTNIDDLNESSLKTYSSEKIYSLDFNRAKWRGKKVIVDGDSITHAGSWHTFLSDWFGWGAIYNHGCSGNTLTKARTASDASGAGSGLKGYERVRQNYEADADAIILMGDGNDWTNVGTYTDTTEDTWCGAMNLMIDAIIEKYPLKPLILISNPPRTGDGRSGLGSLFDNQAKAMKDLAQNRGLYYIDCYHTNMFRPGNTTNTGSFTNNSDGVHLNETASELMAQMIFEELKKVGLRTA